MLITKLKNIEKNEEKYEFLIEIGKDLERLKSTDKSDKNIVPGCFSKVWCVVAINNNLDKDLENTKFKIKAESKSQIINGVLRIILEELDGKTAKEIILWNPDFLNRMGLTALLTPTRANGIFNVVKFIKERVAQIEGEKNI